MNLTLHSVELPMNSELCVKMLKALADGTRWRIVRELLEKPMTVSELTEKLEATQYNVSKHLRILREAGIVEGVKTGIHVVCRVADAFRQKLNKEGQQLDLGCCTFRFDRPPKTPG